jgi:putative Mg2+ transporter-C (MgtC) family protein
METFYAMNLQYLTRILVSAFFGACIGFEREKRFKTAGIRTHILVALSSCLMMIVSKYGFWDVLGTKGVSLDVSRIAAGVVTAIGFLGAGVIFVRKESITGVTTAAGLWATVGVGIATGAGMFLLSGCTTLLILLIQFLLHRPLKIFASQLFGTIQMVVPADLFTKEMLDKTFAEKKIEIKNMQMDRDGDNIVLRLGVVFPQEFGEESIMKEFKEYPYISSIEYYPSN